MLELDAASTLQARASMIDAKPRELLHLPPAIRARYDERLMLCRRAWETTGDPLAIAEALTWTYHYRQPIAEWLEGAAVQALAKLRTKKHAERYRDDMSHFDRYTCVRDAHDGGMTWEEATEWAAKQLGVDSETVWKSYKRVKRQFNNHQPSRFRYWTLKADPRYHA